MPPEIFPAPYTVSNAVFDKDGNAYEIPYISGNASDFEECIKFMENRLSLKLPSTVFDSDYDFFCEHGGVDQGALQKMNEDQRNELYNYAYDKYKMGKDDVDILLRELDTQDGIGICGYAALANIIVSAYHGDAEGFENVHGYKMLNENGKLNDAMILFDIFMDYSLNCVSSAFFVEDEDGLHIDKKYLSDGRLDKQYIPFPQNGYTCKFDVDGMKYLLDQNNVDVSDYDVGNTKINEYSAELATDGYEIFKDLYNSGTVVQLILRGEYDMRDTQTGIPRETGAHAVMPIGVTKNGILVQSDGRLWVVSFDSFKDGNASVDVTYVPVKQGN